jgi:hypothetical protein
MVILKVTLCEVHLEAALRYRNIQHSEASILASAC